ncbi:hypothetical protein [Rhodopirellula sp. SWK7]|uniref:hypothetical protein n=1 Tax=Rhodopirellula sp. SWK7 TaxID=595460 RepID=UPI0002BE757D|nr:hypothetical protein [Rhodopirellula sp. SWK7]EMI46003.1 hypothetical protein RRSWK_01471 [Rhodopirellula sp. SWK7]
MTQDDFDASAPDNTADSAQTDVAASSDVSATPATTHPRFDASEVYEDVPDEETAAVATAEVSDSVDDSPAMSDEISVDPNSADDSDADQYEDVTDATATIEEAPAALEAVDESAESTDPAAGFKPAGSDEELIELQQPFVGQWNSLISTTNWEKGRIISEWREALIEAGAPVTDYSDEAWASRVGGVTSPHVGRLRRVHDRFGEQAKTYPSLYWSHFLAALDWDDAALWLQGAVEEKWSVSIMREQRWKANGAVESDRPGGSQIIEVDLDEDTPDLGTAPAQGGSSTRDYDGDTDGIAAGPAYEAPDFGEETELAALPEGNNMNDANQAEGGGGVGVAEEASPSPMQPFAGLPELPDDLADVIESLKLSVLRHKTAGFEEVDADVIRRYLDAVKMLLES